MQIAYKSQLNKLFNQFVWNGGHQVTFRYNLGSVRQCSRMEFDVKTVYLTIYPHSYQIRHEICSKTVIFLFKGQSSQYDVARMFECLPCSEGCEYCEDERPCVVSLNWVMRTVILILSGVMICCLPIVVFFTWKYGNVKVGVTLFKSIQSFGKKCAIWLFANRLEASVSPMLNLFREILLVSCSLASFLTR